MKKDIRAIKRKMQMANEAANILNQSALKLGVFRPQIPLMPIFAKEK
jgi:hypothetical protein